MFERSDISEGFFTSYLWSNKKLLLAFGVSFFLIANIIYNPWVQPYFSSGSLSIIDWLTALGCAGIYALFRLVMRKGAKEAKLKLSLKT